MDFIAVVRRSPITRNTIMGINIGHTISNASTKIEIKFSEAGNLASAMIDAPARTNIIKRGCMIDIAIPNPNNLTGPTSSKIVMNFGGGVSGSSSPKKLRTARMSNNKPKIKKKISTIALDPAELLEDIKSARLRHSRPHSTYTMYLPRMNEIDLSNP